MNQEVISHTNTFLTDSRATSCYDAGRSTRCPGRTTSRSSPPGRRLAHDKVLTDPGVEVVGIGLTSRGRRPGPAGTAGGWSAP
ncbi:hypothetical protein QJS66_17195 [Kocuria rhizophila]|nr:hypothetical protein QJS66_17195 [Kocuria rhizophila]